MEPHPAQGVALAGEGATPETVTGNGPSQGRGRHADGRNRGCAGLSKGLARRLQGRESNNPCAVAEDGGRAQPSVQPDDDLHDSRRGRGAGIPPKWRAHDFGFGRMFLGTAAGEKKRL